MVAVDLRSLVAKMNDPCRRSLEAAAGYTLSRSHYNVELEHWLLKLLDVPNSDIAAVLRRFEIDSGRVATELTRVLDKLKTGNTRAPSLSPGVVALAREAWLVASLDGGAARIRSGHLLVALLSDEGLSRTARESSLAAGIGPYSGECTCPSTVNRASIAGRSARPRASR